MKLFVEPDATNGVTTPSFFFLFLGPLHLPLHFCLFSSPLLIAPEFAGTAALAGPDREPPLY